MSQAFNDRHTERMHINVVLCCQVHHFNLAHLFALDLESVMTLLI